MLKKIRWEGKKIDVCDLTKKIYKVKQRQREREIKKITLKKNSKKKERKWTG